MLPNEPWPPSGSCSARQSPAPSHPPSWGGRFHILLGTTLACVPTADPIPSQPLKPSWCGCREPSSCRVAVAVPAAVARYGRSGKAGALFHPHCTAWGWARCCWEALVQSPAALFSEKRQRHRIRLGLLLQLSHPRQHTTVMVLAMMSPATYICLNQRCTGVPVPPHAFPQKGKGFRFPGGTAQPDKQVLSCLISQHIFLS